MTSSVKMTNSIVFALALCLVGTRAEVYSSATDMKSIFELERDLAEIISGYAFKLEQKVQRINRYLMEFNDVLREREYVHSDEELLDRIAGNPIHGYKMMKRLTVDFKKIEDEMRSDDWDDTTLAIQRKRLSSVVPKDEDLHGSAQALIRLQDAYELDIRDLVRGEISAEANERYKTAASLSAQDCLFMGKHSFNSGSLARSLEWFEEAWLIAGEEGNKTIRQEQVQQFLDHAAKEHDTRVLNGEKNPNLFPKPVYEAPPYAQRKAMYKARRHANHGRTAAVADPTNPQDQELYNALCRGDDLMSAREVAKLKCSLTSRNDPYFFLHPIKLEQMHRNPNIWLFHDVISAREMDIVKDVAAPLLMRSQVQGKSGGGSEVSMTRTSKTGWLQDNAHPIVDKLTKRVAWMTGLNTNTWNDDAELLQVANYINGGHYNPHHDYVMKDKQPDHMIYLPDKNIFIGDRIATWMFYISEVKSGGRTVFPHIGASIKPVAGAAAFWYNVLPSGDPDRQTLHGACPVLYGTKWVSNKWIREGAQLFKRPCGLTRDHLLDGIE